MLVPTINNFKQGMNPNIYGTGISRIEHFSDSSQQARPFRKIGLGTSKDYDNNANPIPEIKAFTRGTGGGLYCLGYRYTDYQTNRYIVQIGQWDTNNLCWLGYSYLNAIAIPFPNFWFFQGKIYGLCGGTNLWKIDPPFVSNAYNYKSLAYTYSAPALVSLYENKVYIPTDNKISIFDGTNLTTGLSVLPSTFIITAIWENGININIVGYDSVTQEGMCYVCDGQGDSITNLIEKYDLYQERPYWGGNIGGTNFIISLNQGGVYVGGGANETRMTIRYINGTKLLIKSEFRFQSITLQNTAFYTHYGRVYFNASVQFYGDNNATHHCVFRLDENGELSIAQNLDVISGTPQLTGLIRSGDNFFIGTGTATGGAYNTQPTFATSESEASFVVTPWYQSTNASEMLQPLGYGISCEPLPIGSSIIVYTRADTETAWTKVSTFDTVGMLSGTSNNKILGTEESLDVSVTRQFKISCLGGAVLLGFQAVLEGVGNQPYHIQFKMRGSPTLK